MLVGDPQGGRSQQVQLIRVDRVENFYAAPSRSRSRSRGRSSGTGGTMAPMRATAGRFTTKCAFGIAKGALNGEAVQCLCALVRRADQGELPARQARLRRARRASGAPGDRDDVGEAVRSRCSSSASTGWRISALRHRGAAAAVAVAAVALVAPWH